MKSVRRNDGTIGNVKLGGKVEKVLSCKCCVMQNFKWPERIKEAFKEIKEYNETHRTNSSGPQ